ncbi:pickpocket protein 28 isoform X1 [Ooceraea biroi]|nr:pickpocket protein 28 isoform X1 [Ooceraea biroi]XP_011338677.1 pickpocket protein 28 isoform X1 [Ooceraea biroi]EZA54394.1 Sodium channel protein Nach [Ooceraea biroi]
MEESSSSELDKTRSSINAWNDARILTHVANIGKTHDLNHLRLYNPNVMTTRPYNRNCIDIGNDSYYNNTDKPSLDYLRAGNTLPYSINTLHLQNTYRPSQRLEAFAFHDNSKDMYRSHDFILRSRHNNNNLFIKKDPVANKNSDQENKKTERSKKKKHQVFTDCMEFFQQYCANSSLHGLRYVGDSSLSAVERIFWLISFLAALIIVTIYIYFIYQRWTHSPIIIALSPEPVSLTEFPFPSVTICNMNHVKKSEATKILRGSDSLEKVLLDDVCDRNYNTTDDGIDENIEWERIERFKINTSQSCTDMLYYCVWHGSQHDCNKIFNSVMTDEGICCNFNSVNRKYLLYNPRDWPDLNISYSAVSIDWNAEKGYNASTPTDVIPQRPPGTGLSYGLTLALDAETDEYYCGFTSAGFKMLLHSPVETPKIADFSFAIMPGKETRVILKPRISVANSRIIAIQQKKRKCYFTAERKLRYYRTYTQRNCVLECEANFTQEMCGCVQYYMPKSAKTKICGKRDTSCAVRAKTAMELGLYDDDTASSLNISKLPHCTCWPACYEINYKAQLSQSELLPTLNIDAPYVKKNMDYFTKNVAVVHLFFVDSQFTKYVKNELFGFTEFLSSTGGLLGLFMGFSFLSAMEIVYFLTLRAWCRMYRRRQAAKPAVLQIHPAEDKTVIYPFAN